VMARIQKWAWPRWLRFTSIGTSCRRTGERERTARRRY